MRAPGNWRPLRPWANFQKYPLLVNVSSPCKGLFALFLFWNNSNKKALPVETGGQQSHEKILLLDNQNNQ